MGNEEWLRTFVFLLKFKTSDMKEIGGKLSEDRAKWGEKKECVFLPVTGDFDMVVLAYGGTTEDALVYGAYLAGTPRYTVCSTLTGFDEREFRFAVGLLTEDPHKKG
jgi:hypothetical protein